MGSIIIEDDEFETGSLEVDILEKTKLAGEEYILALDSHDKTTAYIMHLVEEEGEEGFYEFVEDENTLIALTKVFAELSDDIDFEIEKKEE